MAWRNLFKKTSAQTTGQPITSEDIAKMVFGGGLDGISPETAIRLATVNTCVRVLSESVGLVPCVVYQTTPDGGRKKAVDHHLYDVLRHKPNGWQTAYEYWEYQTRCVLMRGNGYSTKTKVGAEVRELIPQDPRACSVKQLNNYSLQYALPKGVTKKQDDIFHLRDATDDGYTGISRIRQASRALNIASAAEEWGYKVFREYGIQPGYFKTPGKMDVDQKNDLRKHWKGLSGSRDDDEIGLPILSGDMEYKGIDINLEDAQFIEARKFQREDVCGIFRVPPHIAQLYEKSTSWGTGIEQVTLQFVVFTLMPILRRFESSAEVNLLTPRERREFKIRFNVNTLLRGDMKARGEFYYKMLLTGAMSINEVRRLENLNPVPGGDIHRVPSNTEELIANLLNESEEQQSADSKLNSVAA